MKDIIVLAVESSCDETSVAIVKNGKEVLSNIVSSQIDIHKKFGGVVPEVASRHHVENITLVLDEAIKKANIKVKDITCVAVTKGPGLIGSLLVGINAAKAFSFANHLPLIGVHHIAGHIYANHLVEDLQFPLLALVVSGGHTELVYMKDHYHFDIIGQTRDDAVGEAYDKVARVIGLPYPGGPHIDKLANEGIDLYKLPRVMLDQDNFDFSFSGLKSAVINLVHNATQRNETINRENLARSFQESVVDILVGKTVKAIKKNPIKQLIIAGGVAANSGLRKRLHEEIKSFPDIKLIIPPLKYCTDNAAMIAVAGTFSYLNGQKDDLSLNGKANLDL
ncbi:tRNA (adenosine(37)-N6)-threonylcarbamoyltransferase complex transferase subunit TsaD [Mycoplasmatota bacterium]|nr:tRNA (adenosine(37)-N6)-threonylcarbamoyltransferase complex transferase subunit TsaD [Mycoplasmatota bacterium]